MTRRLALEAIELLLVVVLRVDSIKALHDHTLPLALLLVRRELARERGLHVVQKPD
jgi:hypothetical protein